MSADSAAHPQATWFVCVPEPGWDLLTQYEQLVVMALSDYEAGATSLERLRALLAQFREEAGVDAHS